jgi:hypothetical protein
MIDKGEVVPVLQGFVLRKKRQKALVCLVWWVFLWIIAFRFIGSFLNVLQFTGGPKIGRGVWFDGVAFVEESNGIW